MHPRGGTAQSQWNARCQVDPLPTHPIRAQAEGAPTLSRPSCTSKLHSTIKVSRCWLNPGPPTGRGGLPLFSLRCGPKNRGAHHLGTRSGHSQGTPSQPRGREPLPRQLCLQGVCKSARRVAHGAASRRTKDVIFRDSSIIHTIPKLLTKVTTLPAEFRALLAQNRQARV